MLSELKEKPSQPLIPEGANVRQWIEARLSESNDQAIVDYLKNLHPTQAEKGYEQLRSLVERQEVRIGNSTHITRYFAVPILLESENALTDDDIEQVDLRGLLRSFHRFGLLGKKDGVVLLPNLVGHDYVDTYSPSGLYNQAQAIFMSAVAGQSRTTQVAKPVSSIQTDAGYLTMCFLVGVVHWKQGKEPPKMFSGASDAFAEWKAFAARSVSFSMQSSELVVPSVRIEAPQPIFAAFAEGQWKLAEQVLSNLCSEFTDMGVSVEVSIRVTSDAWSPARNYVSVEIAPVRGEMPGNSFEIGLDEVKGMSIATFIKNVDNLMKTAQIKIKSKQYHSVANDGVAGHGCFH